MSSYRFEDYTFEALCLNNPGSTLAYVVGLVDSENHAAANPDTARHEILYPLSEGEGYVDRASEILGMQAEFLPANYWPQTPVMFARRSSPIIAMLERGFEPVILTRKTEKAPHAIATGIWKPGIAPGAKKIDDCIGLFGRLLTKVAGKMLGELFQGEDCEDGEAPEGGYVGPKGELYVGKNPGSGYIPQKR